MPPKKMEGKQRIGAGKGKTPHAQQRGDDATQALLSASLALVSKFGVDAVTIDRLSVHSGMAKTTIYRRWPNVSAILMDAVLSEVNLTAPIKRQATARETFMTAMKLLVRLYSSQHGRTLRALIGRAQVDSSLLQAVETRWVEPRRELAREVLREGVRRGEIRPELDADVVLDLLYGAIYHRLLVPYKRAALNDLFVEKVVDAVFDGLATRRS